MYSILLSKIELGYLVIEERLKNLVNKDSKVVIIPWSFPNETTKEGLDEYVASKINAKYVKPLVKLGVKEENIKYLNCYSDEVSYMLDLINSSNILILTGGNPEMLYNKISKCNLMDAVKNYDKLIIGSSAGAVLQFNDYFITAKNNYYGIFDWYKGIGTIDNDFFIDVHSACDSKYISEINEGTKDRKKDVYLIFNDGAIIYNRKTKEIEIYGQVMKLD